MTDCRALDGLWCTVHKAGMRTANGQGECAEAITLRLEAEIERLKSMAPPAVIATLDRLSNGVQVAESRLKSATALIAKCLEVADDGRQFRRARHGYQLLYSELSVWLAGKNVTLCAHDGPRRKTTEPYFDACGKCESLIPKEGVTVPTVLDRTNPDWCSNCGAILVSRAGRSFPSCVNCS